MSKLFNAERWELLAEEAMMIAEGMQNPEAKRMMLGVVEDYHALARRAESYAQSARISPLPGTENRRSVFG
jgi:hypothetical protein